MAWNEPGKNDNDPWGNGNRNRGKNDGPPDLDEVLKKAFGKLFGGGGGGGSGGGGKRDGSGAVLVVLVIVGLLVFYIGKGVGIVNEQERAVVLQFGKYSETKGPGLRWNPPFLEKVFTENVTRVRSWSTSEQMLTKDLNVVDVNLSVQYSIESAKDFVLNVKSPEESLHQAANSALRHVVGSSLMHEVLTEGRSLIAAEVQARLQQYLNAYTAGIRIDKVNIEETSPPKEVQWAFDDVIKAREDEERFKNEAQAYANGKIPLARGTAQRMVEEAMAYREEVIARAEGEAERFTLLLGEYSKAPEVTRQRLYIDALEDVLTNSSKVMVDVEGGNNMMYLPLDKILEKSTTSAANRPAVTSSEEIDELAQQIVRKLQNEARVRSTSPREGR